MFHFYNWVAEGSRLSFHSRGLPVCLELVCLLVGMIKFLPCAMRMISYSVVFSPRHCASGVKNTPQSPSFHMMVKCYCDRIFSVTQIYSCNTFIGDGESICILMHIDKALLMLGIARIFPRICRYVRALCHLKYRICVMEICM